MTDDLIGIDVYEWVCHLKAFSGKKNKQINQYTHTHTHMLAHM